MVNRVKRFREIYGDCYRVFFTDQTSFDIFARHKVSVEVNMGVSLKFLIFANLESVRCEVYFPGKKSEKLILNKLKSLFFVSRHNLCAKYD